MENSTRVLVVDDSAVDRTIAGRLLEKDTGFAVSHAEDGREALSAIEKEKPDLVVTDLDMPELNGLELVTEMHVAGFDAIPVILMTAKGSEELAVEALNRGAAGYVTKARLAEDLLGIVNRALSAVRESRDLSVVTQALKSCSVEFEVPGDADRVFPLSDLLTKHLDLIWQVSSLEKLRITTAIEEALSNALYHGTLELDPDLRDSDPQLYYTLAAERVKKSPYVDRRIRVALDADASVAKIKIADDGPGFDTVSLPEDGSLDFLSEGTGRGVGLMQTFMDDVQWNDLGNEVTLIKNRTEHKPDSGTTSRNRTSRMLMGLSVDDE